MTQQRVRLSSASFWAWGVAGVAVAAAGWHVWAITETPARPFFWALAVIDLVIAATAAWQATRWPVHADFGPDAVRLGRTSIPYESITGVRRGDASAKSFWVAVWLPTSLIVGVIAALRPADAYDRDVVELTTAKGIARFRWRDSLQGREFLDALGSTHEPSAIPDDYHPARDYTPKLSVGGGLLVAALAFWLVIGGQFSLDLFDLSTAEDPYPVAETSATLQTLTSRLTGFAPLAGVPADYYSENCDRTNNAILGPSPDVVDLHLRIIGPSVATSDADAIEARLRGAIGMAPDDALFSATDTGADVSVDIPGVNTLYIEVFTGCVNASGLPTLRADLAKMAAALGVDR